MAKLESNHKKFVKLRLAREHFWESLEEETRQNIVGIVFFVLSILLILSYFNFAGMIGKITFRLFDFLLGLGYFLLPAILVFEGVRFFRLKQMRMRFVSLLGGVSLVASVLGLMNLLRSDSAGVVGKAIGIIERYLGPLASTIIYLGLLLIAILILSNQSLAALFSRKQKVEKEVRVKFGGIEEGAEAISEKFLPEKKEVIEAQTKKQKVGEHIRITELRIKRRVGAFQLPPLDLLEKDSSRPSSGDIKANANIIKRTLENFGIPVEMAEVNVGPTVTQYTLKPAQGVKLSKIVTLQNDLSLSLAAHPLRIEAPIPGKSLIGIEIPNKSAALVRLRNLLEHETFLKSADGLVFTLGRDVSGEPLCADLAKFPHLLIAGATGSGKSVFIHSLIVTFLFRHTPYSLNLILIDPKRVELSVYNKIPQLLAPVITDGKKSVAALQWLIGEMERRYDLLLEADARDIESYNRKQASQDEKMPYIILVIDELADLMAAYGREVEGFVVRLAQMSRATGIHLVISTQRPSVEVITGLIKANIPARIAFQVAFQVDSRTILDMGGAEKLLGSGDMLFLAPDSAKPKRLQGPLLSEREIRRVVEFWAKQSSKVEDMRSAGDLQSELMRPKTSGGIFGAPAQLDLEGYETGEEDELYPQALEVVLIAKKASASLLQRRLKVGYARAARLLDILEARGVIGPGEGAKPRKILISSNQEEF